MVWDTVSRHFDQFVSMRHEHVIICTRGSCIPDISAGLPDSLYTERERPHVDDKPEWFRKEIERMYPMGQRIELFGTRDVEGWTVYGGGVVSNWKRTA
jgi:N6-adenosine-specific RNA methylase IME4